MSPLTQLDVVNAMLATVGELPLNELDTGHPYVPAALRSLATASRVEQSKAWWFNREQVRLSPDTEGNIIVPTGTLRIDPVEESLNYVQRGRRLYKPYDLTGDKYKFTQDVVCWLVREIEFEDLPAAAADVVSLAAQIDFQRSYDADQTKYQQITLEYRSALITLNTEHIRNVNANLLRAPDIVRTMNRIGRGTFPFIR